MIQRTHQPFNVFKRLKIVTKILFKQLHKLLRELLSGRYASLISGLIQVILGKVTHLSFGRMQPINRAR